MNVLLMKLWRTIWNTKGQFLAVAAVVMVGISVFISMTTSYYNLNRSQDLFYRENNFADYYFHVVRAPQEITKQIESVPGVIKATGRIQMDIPVIKEGNNRATARVTSYPLPMDREVNRLELLTGRMFEKYPQGGGVEVLVDPQYAKANQLNVNSIVTVVAGGKRVPLTVVGTGTSPEFIYPMKDAASMMPEPETFGIVMIPQNQAQQIQNLPGQINQVVVKLAPGVDAEETAAGIRTILEPYGNLASYPRKQQLSHAVLQGELDGLEVQAQFMPAIFLCVAAAIQFIILGRMVKTQRLQIGIMKALGYHNRQIMWHYVSYALAVAVAGAALGLVFGLMLASVFSKAYAMFFNLPGAIGGFNFRAIFSGVALSLMVGLLAGLAASRGVVRINPAESMRPEPPRSARSIFLDRWGWLWRKLGSEWKMTLRTVGRNRARFGFTVVGVVFAVGMLVVSFFAKDSIDYMLKTHFFREQHYDFLLRFSGPVRESELLNISRIDGVIKVEPIFELPVKMHFNGRSEDDLLLGLPGGVTLKTLVNDKGRPVRLPEDGILISQRSASKLGVRIGDRFEVETLLGVGPSHRGTLKVAGVNRQLVGSSSYVNLSQVNGLLQEGQLVSGAMLKVDQGKADQVERGLNEMTGIASVSSREKELGGFTKNMGSMIYAVTIMIMFSVILGFAIVYNSSLIGFAERKRELASLRVIGYTNREVSGLLLREILLQAACGVIFGLPFGRWMAESYVNAVSTELFTMPVVVYPQTYLLSAIGGIAFMMAGLLFVVKGVKKLDLVEVLKNRD